MTRHVLDVTDLSAGEIRSVLELSARAPGELGSPLRVGGVPGGVALIFEKPSLRTRQSMEIAVAQLGGHPVTTREDEIGLDHREPVEDVTRVLCGYHTMIAARVYDHGVLDRMAAVADRPVINMLSNRSHPLQAFADVATMTNAIGDLAGCTIAWVGDYNNVAKSLGEACSMLGARLRFGCPEGYGPDDAELERLLLLGAVEVVSTGRAAEAVEGADAVHTDTWVSMGDEAVADVRRRAFEGFTVDAQLMASARPDAVFLHCLPAYRGVEVTADVIDGPRSLVIEQGHQRVHTARGLLAFLAAQSGGHG